MKGKVLAKADIQKLSENERLKYEIAEELGLYDKVIEGGWRSLTAKEAGRIGGMVTKRRKAMKKEALQSELREDQRMASIKNVSNEPR
ncbi:MAG: alpha/beta-type small acid-soluble spore protein [Clostridiales bacterium]|nr:alpha/beta-type small acid-soluble spore protein [Clostridiales bacterium]MDY3747754.1 small, acid-soluble spore protein, alpha/beta type [Lachnospiraceae bacterium]